MPRLAALAPKQAQPQLPSAMVQQLDVVANTFALPRARVLRVILLECLTDESLRGLIVDEIARRRLHRPYGGTTMVSVPVSKAASTVFADLMATTDARASEVARAILTVACDGRLSRFKKALMDDGSLHDGVIDCKRVKLIKQATRLGLEVQVKV